MSTSARLQFPRLPLAVFIAASLLTASGVAVPYCLAQDMQEDVRSKPVLHGRIPTNPEYWRFLRWYVDHSVLDVYVNGAQPEHLARVLKEIETLKERKVLIRDIVVIGGNNFPHLDASTRERVRSSKAFTREGRQILLRSGIDPGLAVLADSIDLSEGSADSSTESRLEHLGVSQSPTWVVHHRGKQYVLEGVSSLRKYFSRDGKFRERE